MASSVRLLWIGFAVLLVVSVATGALAWTAQSQVALETARLEAALDTRSQSLQGRIDHVESGLTDTRNDLSAALAQRVETLIARLDAMDAALGERITTEGAQLASDVASLRGRLEEVHAELVAADTSLRGDISDQHTTLAAVTSELDQLEVSTADLQGRVTQASLDVSSVYNHVKDGVVEVLTGNAVVGSGFVYGAEKRYVVTAWHVASAIPSNMTVRTADGAVVSATVATRSEANDVAVLRLEAPLADAAPLSLADSSTVDVGEPVLVVGSPATLRGSASLGIVSAVGRSQADFPPDFFPTLPGFNPTDLIQVDAAINPGNSGGPLFNAAGEVIGFASFGIIYDGAGGSRGLNFAVASNAFRQLADSIVGG